jgi:signal transduction histidine kinase
MDRDELMRLAARGALAGAVTSELATPLARMADTLAALVDRLDRHVAGARGPEPLPWSAVGMMRERLAESYLAIGRIRRLAADLALVVADRGERRPESADPNELVERALSLARHRFSSEQEVLLDLGTVAAVHVDAARVVPVLAHLLFDAAAAADPASVIVVRTSEAEGGGAVAVTIAFGAAAALAPFSGFVVAEITAEGGTLTYTGDAAVVTLPVTK